jgi:DNA-binding beta-propeller fold protein YncE
VVDYLASQGSLGYSSNDNLLFAVNAGSNTISVFRAHNDSLALQEVLPSGGMFPVSVTVHGNLVYVLNAENGGSVQGYRIVRGLVVPIFGSNRALGLDPSLTPQFTNTPGQVAFSPDGSQLIVTTKANGNDIDVFQVFGNGQLSAAPVVNSEPNAVPFAATFDPAGNLVVAETGLGALVTFSLSPSGVAIELDAAATGQAATCWVVAVNGNLYASNAGSASLSQFQDTSNGILSLEGQTSTDPGTVDAAGAADGSFLYVQTGANGIVDEFHVAANGSLSPIGSVTVAGAAGGEGIVAF